MSAYWLWMVAGVFLAVLLVPIVRDGIQLRRLIRWAEQPIGTPGAQRRGQVG